LTGEKFGQPFPVRCNASSSLINSLSTSLESVAVRPFDLDVLIEDSGGINYIKEMIG
jgi:hypothetical protein